MYAIFHLFSLPVIEMVRFLIISKLMNMKMYLMDYFIAFSPFPDYYWDWVPIHVFWSFGFLFLLVVSLYTCPFLNGLFDFFLMLQFLKNYTY